jgi:hypothetical protein
LRYSRDLSRYIKCEHNKVSDKNAHSVSIH